MKIVILGCGRMGAMLATRLSEAGNDIAIIDQESCNFQRLGAGFQGRKINGNGTERDTLMRAGIEAADIFVAITQGDNRNIMASEIARVMFNVPRVYTRIKDPLRAESFGHSGLETFCTTTIAASFVESLIVDPAAASSRDRAELAASRR